MSKFPILPKLNLISRTTYYHYTKNFVHHKINHAWVKKQPLQSEEKEKKLGREFL